LPWSVGVCTSTLDPRSRRTRPIQMATHAQKFSQNRTIGTGSVASEKWTILLLLTRSAWHLAAHALEAWRRRAGRSPPPLVALGQLAVPAPAARRVEGSRRPPAHTRWRDPQGDGDQAWRPQGVPSAAWRRSAVSMRQMVTVAPHFQQARVLMVCGQVLVLGAGELTRASHEEHVEEHDVASAWGA